MGKLTIVLVDDDEKITKLLRAYFEAEGFAVLTARDGYIALDMIQSCQPDLVILDVMLPGIDGYEICRRVRRESDVPIIMLTARDEEPDRLTGLEIGADDYVAKPFSPREVVARGKVILRRMRKVPVRPRPIRTNSLVVDPERFEARYKGEPLELTPTEFKLLELLAANPDRVFSRLQLVERVQGSLFEGYERTIDAHIKNLRRKLGDNPRSPQLILTVYGMGYKLKSGDLP
ncbi:MAG: response regulator transcription factor [Sporomusaceae bacterium]|nr:response regulator transcription factor [Sporomusaceae bacterium]